MRKRNQVVVLSSDDEEEDKTRSVSLNRSYNVKSKSRSLVSRTQPRQPAKKPRTSALTNGFTKIDESRWFSEDVNEVFYGFKVSAGSGCKANELWINKYKPHTLEELAVHKKKVAEVKMWFEEKLASPKGKRGNQVLVINGQAGVGKSTTIDVIASQLGANLYEWNTPTPTVWQECMHNSGAGVCYTSKLEEFENFVERVRKYGLIPSSWTEGSKSSDILLIDDLPVANGRNSYGRLQGCLHLLVQSVHIPTVILLTDYGKARSAEGMTQCLEELQLSLESAGACKVVFNPITDNSIKKVLLRICRQEQCNVTAEQIELIAKASGGDIRHAVTSLQFFCLKPDPMLSLSNSSSPYLDDKKDELHSLNDRFSIHFGRDENLSLFHALGKFLHNKRETDDATIMEEDMFILHEKFTRLPLKMDAPEKVLCQAHGEARPIAEFLHENVLDFMSEEAIDDAWAVASYLGDADLLLTIRGKLSKNSDAESILQSTAASVAVRGVLFGNSQPLRSRWHAIRRPRLWQVEQASLHSKYALVRQRSVAYNGRSLSNVSTIATEYTPVLNWFEISGGREGCEVTTMDGEIDDIDMDKMILDDEEDEISDDEIEEW